MLMSLARPSASNSLLLSVARSLTSRRVIFPQSRSMSSPFVRVSLFARTTGLPTLAGPFLYSNSRPLVSQTRSRPTPTSATLISMTSSSRMWTWTSVAVGRQPLHLLAWCWAHEPRTRPGLFRRLRSAVLIFRYPISSLSKSMYWYSYAHNNDVLVNPLYTTPLVIEHTGRV